MDFHRYLHYVYTETFDMSAEFANDVDDWVPEIEQSPIPECFESEEEEKEHENLQRLYRNYVGLYLLADFIHDIMLKNTSMSAFRASIKNADWLPDHDLLHHVYNKTTPGAPLRAMLVDAVLSSIYHHSRKRPQTILQP
jgi:hypothetical protein